jgi:flagellar L-ring protein precursor FlgH
MTNDEYRMTNQMQNDKCQMSNETSGASVYHSNPQSEIRNPQLKEATGNRQQAAGKRQTGLTSACHSNPQSAIRNLQLLCLLVVLSLSAPALADSIWAKGNRSTRATVRDDVARDVGDVLTIVISERSVIDQTTSRSGEKKTSRSAKSSGTLDLANLTGAVGDHIFDFPRIDASAESSTKFEGDADYGTNRTMVDQITVIVQDVQPNGNLVVIGTRTREVAGDKQVIQVSGVVRPSDIGFNNVVASERVADFHIVHKTSGFENRYTKPGWLTNFLDVINPF